MQSILHESIRLARRLVDNIDRVHASRQDSVKARLHTEDMGDYRSPETSWAITTLMLRRVLTLESRTDANCVIAVNSFVMIL